MATKDRCKFYVDELTDERFDETKHVGSYPASQRGYMQATLAARATGRGEVSYACDDEKSWLGKVKRRGVSVSIVDCDKKGCHLPKRTASSPDYASEHTLGRLRRSKKRRK